MDQWQYVGSDPESWEYGTMVRGVVRGIKAQVFFAGGEEDSIWRPGWRWRTFGLDGVSDAGVAESRLRAILAAEKAMGIE